MLYWNHDGGFLLEKGIKPFEMLSWPVCQAKSEMNNKCAAFSDHYSYFDHAQTWVLVANKDDSYQTNPIGFRYKQKLACGQLYLAFLSAFLFLWACRERGKESEIALSRPPLRMRIGKEKSYNNNDCVNQVRQSL
jgi:hypothetical protein